MSSQTSNVLPIKLCNDRISSSFSQLINFIHKVENPLQRNEKKTENAIIKSLNAVCKTLKNELDGFSWLTHFVDYSQFPQSLKLVFVFDTNQALLEANNKAFFKTIFELTETRLSNEGVYIKRIDKAVFFDTEENGADFNDLNWCRKYS